MESADSLPLPGLRVVGVLGGVGSGKSTAARILAEELPATHLDADAEVTRLFADPGLLASLAEQFGPTILDSQGQLDREVLGKRVFGDEKARKQLEGVLHPAVRRSLWEGLERAEQVAAAAWVVLDVPLLLENGLSKACDTLLYVAVPDALRCARACARHGWDEETWRAREAAQISVSEKEAAADAILSNAGGVDDLRIAVRDLLPVLRALPPRSLRDRWPDPGSPPLAAPDA